MTLNAACLRPVAVDENVVNAFYMKDITESKQKLLAEVFREHLWIAASQIVMSSVSEASLYVKSSASGVLMTILQENLVKRPHAFLGQAGKSTMHEPRAAPK